MIIVLHRDATQQDMDHIIERVKKLGLTPHISKGVERTIIGVIGPEDVLRVTPLEAFPGRDSFCFDFIDLFYSIAGMHQAIGQFPIIRE